MKPEKRIEKFLRRIDVIPDAERKRLRLEELLEARDKTKKPTSVVSKPTIRRIIMNRKIWKIAASLMVAATMIGVIGILQNGDQAAYAFEQTVAAMQGKSFYHIQTYYSSPTKRADEFWAEFNEHGKLIRVRQSDQWKREGNPVEVLWDNGLEYKYRPKWGGILTIRKAEHHVDENRLEEFDPEKMVEEAYMYVEKGQATIDIDDSHAHDGYLVVEIKGNHQPYGGLMVLQVDPITKLVLRMDLYDDEDDDEGNYFVVGYRKGIEVLEYNQPFDSKLFDPNYFLLSFKDAVVIDQVSEPVGMAEGGLRSIDAAYEVARQGLEAWAADDYETAGLLFGGAPKEFFERRQYRKPVSDTEFIEVNPYEWNGSKFKVRCNYVAERNGELITMNAELLVSNRGQPGRWFIDPEFVQLRNEE
ncbi:MAG: hypothetical protein ACYSTT_08005 [Planctomycetota bacterium]|jgi:hypothetical protein